MATDRPKLNKDGHTYKGDDGFTVKETEYHKVTCFNGLAKAIANNRQKWVSTVEKSSSKFQAALDSLVETFEGFEN